MDDFSILTQSIGEYAVSVLGPENLRGLQVLMNPRDLTGHISIVLEDESDESQKQILRSLFDVERVFFDEAVLSFSFVREIDADLAESTATPIYSYA